MMMPILRTRWTRKLTVAVTAFALGFSQTAPAFAYGPNGAFGGRDDVRAMGYFRVPLGASQAGKPRTPSFGFTVQRQFHFNDRNYETSLGPYRDSQHLDVGVLDLRFGMNGKLAGFDVGGFDALGFKTRLNATDDGGGGGVPTWIWIVGGVVAGLGVTVLAIKVASDKCDGWRAPSAECGDFDNLPQHFPEG
jgi:hypothetical protein